MHDDLDDEQRAAVNAAKSAIAVLAGPGSGKTRTLAYRTRQLLTDGPATRALALTFTNKAAAEMKARALGVSSVSSDRIRAGTFHGFGAMFLRTQGHIVGIREDFEIIDPDEQQVFADRLAHNGSKLASQWGSARLRDLAPATDVALFGEAYEAAKRDAGVVDFDDLVVHTSQILRANPDIAKAFALRYAHILVDEFQDTNRAQFEIVRALALDAETVSVFADDDQAIFRFTGADRDHIQHFIDELAATVYPLTCNYRCRSMIVSKANALIASDLDSSGRRMRAFQQGGSVTLRTAASVNAEARELADEIAMRIERGQPAHDIAILVRSGFRANALMDELRARRVPVSDWRGDTYQSKERRLFLTSLSAVRGSLSDRQATALCDLMDVETSELRVTEELLAAHESNVIGRELRELRTLVFAGGSLVSIAQKACDAATLAEPHSAAELQRIVGSVSDFAAHDPDFTLDDLLADLTLGGGGRPPTVGGGIKVATLHKTKGLEWPTVYLVGLEDDCLPGHWCDDDEIPEERRLCFVGVCRAETELIVTFARSSGRFPKDPSRFLSEMGLDRA